MENIFIDERVIISLMLLTIIKSINKPIEIFILLGRFLNKFAKNWNYSYLKSILLEKLISVIVIYSFMYFLIPII